MNRFDMPPEVTGFGSPIPPKVVKAAPLPAETWKPYTTPGFEINGIGQLRTTDGPVSKPEPPLAALPKPAPEALKGETGRWMSEADGCQSFGTYDGATMKDVGPYVGMDFAAGKTFTYAEDSMLGAASGAAMRGDFSFRSIAEPPHMKALADMRDSIMKQMYQAAALQVASPMLMYTPGRQVGKATALDELRKQQGVKSGLLKWMSEPDDMPHQADMTSVPGCMCDGCVASRKYGQ